MVVKRSIEEMGEDFICWKYINSEDFVEKSRSTIIIDGKLDIEWLYEYTPVYFLSIDKFPQSLFQIGRFATSRNSP